MLEISPVWILYALLIGIGTGLVLGTLVAITRDILGLPTPDFAKPVRNWILGRDPDEDP